MDIFYHTMDIQPDMIIIDKVKKLYQLSLTIQ